MTDVDDVDDIFHDANARENGTSLNHKNVN